MTMADIMERVFYITTQLSIFLGTISLIAGVFYFIIFMRNHSMSAKNTSVFLVPLGMFLLVTFTVLNANTFDSDQVTATSKVSPLIHSTVVNKDFSPGQSNVSPGLSLTGQLFLTDTTTSNVYTLILENDTIQVSKDDWFDVEIGDIVSYEEGFFGVVNLQITENKRY